jgi:hypothetical protein
MTARFAFFARNGSRAPVLPGLTATTIAYDCGFGWKKLLIRLGFREVDRKFSGGAHHSISGRESSCSKPAGHERFCNLG